MEARIRLRVWVSGRVQGVAFRAATHRTAQAAGVAGFVRNLADGRVEAVFEGERGAVEALLDWCGEGPAGARVDGLEIQEEDPEGLSGFVIR